jgi:hypothetical protein
MATTKGDWKVSGVGKVEWRTTDRFRQKVNY